MSITRTHCETIIVSRLEGLMTAAGMAVTVVGSNSDLDDPLAWATRGVGSTTADPSTVTNAELADVAVSDYDDLLMLTEYRTLKNMLGNLDDVDISAGPRSEKLSQLADQVSQMIDAMESDVTALVDELEGGYISLDFAEHYRERLT